MPELKSMATDADNNTYLAGDAVIRHVSVFGARGGRGMASDILIQAYENRNVGASVCNHGIGQTSEAETFFSFYKAANPSTQGPVLKASMLHLSPEDDDRSQSMPKNTSFYLT